MARFILLILFLSVNVNLCAQSNTADIDKVVLLRRAGKEPDAKKATAVFLNNLPKDEFQIRELAGYCFQSQSVDLAISIFLEGRKILQNNQAFAYELLRIYQLKKDKNMLAEEFINALETMPEMLIETPTILGSTFETKTDYQILEPALLKKIKKKPNDETYYKLLIWNYLQQQNYESALTQLIAQDKRIHGEGAPLYNAISSFVAGQAYATATKAYQYLLSKGKENEYYLNAKVELINLRFKQLESSTSNAAIRDLATQYESIFNEYGKNLQTLFAIKKWAYLQGWYLNNAGLAQKAIEEALLIPGISGSENASLKLDLGDIYILNEQPWEAFLVYEQVATKHETEPIGSEARFKATKLSFYQGNFVYSKSQADVLKASTSQLIANDALNLSLLISDNLQTATDSLALKMYASAELLVFERKTAQAIIKLDSISTAYPGNSLLDDILMLKSKIYINASEFRKAELLLKELIANQSNSIWVDDAIFTLAGLYEQKLNNPEEAKALYQKLINDFPGSMFTAEARKLFRKLRGDNIGT
ncbi:hypothetical protein LPB86_05695 [Pedobacter sp. MC2016-14]|uniref:tetratricopeptide repeat protein n=1 Tax=Pedobacter sp. MC2016-14 TaxID=2897327 RepID=UPI001E3FE772|nr:hypothetical protein [Pedobacter sp. MC2016-14]MCD0487711.1 hypothetical protein [Pedobacter sp. MC2016-14]